MNTDAIKSLAQTFGAKQLAAMEALSEIAFEAGIGMSWSMMAETFEGAMDGFCDQLGLRVSDPVRDLFAAEARLTFYGAMTDRGNIRMWQTESTVAVQEIAEAERAAA